MDSFCIADFKLLLFALAQGPFCSETSLSLPYFLALLAYSSNQNMITYLLKSPHIQKITQTHIRNYQIILAHNSLKYESHFHRVWRYVDSKSPQNHQNPLGIT